VHFWPALAAVLFPLNATWWSFWVVNLGPVVPVVAIVAVASAASWLMGRHPDVGAARWASSLLRPFPPDVRRFALIASVLFALGNVVVLQSWDWDNTKVFVYWYFGAALLLGALAVFWWTTLWRRLLSLLLVGSVLATGVTVLVRLIPWQSGCTAVAAASNCYSQSIAGPYTLIDAPTLQAMQTVERVTSADAVFLTPGQFNDPVSVVTGRPVVMGYEGWLWSYGIDYSKRKADVATALNGCGATSIVSCRSVVDVLHRYDVSYVEVPQDGGANAAWWSSQPVPVVVRTPSVVIYDVRRT